MEFTDIPLPLPAWATVFVRKTDSRYDAEYKVTAKEALDILAEIND